MSRPIPPVRSRTRVIAFLAIASVTAVMAACAAHLLRHDDIDAPLPRAAQPVGVIRITATPVALDPVNPANTRLGQLTYLWGAQLRSDSTSRFGGLSGLEVEPWSPPVMVAGGDPSEQAMLQFTTNSDEGDILQWRVPMTGQGRFDTVEGRLAPLRDLQGRPLQTKRFADSEDISADGRGGYFISFEREHRIWDYWNRVSILSDMRPTPAANWPRVPLPENDGFESIATVTDAAGGAPRALMVGSEDGRVWRCALTPSPRGDACAPVLPTGGPDGFKLTGLDQLPGSDDLVALYRAFDPIRGVRAIVARIRPSAPPDARVEVLARLSPPLTVDNMEGVAALPNGRGGWTLWLISDDNFSAAQRTLLLAFDYTPGTPAR